MWPCLLRTYAISALVFLELIILLVGVDDWVVVGVVVGVGTEVDGVMSSTVVLLCCACSLYWLSKGLT